MNRYDYALSINGVRTNSFINTRTEKAAMAAVLYMAVRRIRSWPEPLGRVNISLELVKRERG